ncbi:MAG: Uma2 family endonuclease, partial [Pseudomonadota bacterium]
VEPEVHLENHVVVPDIAGWRRARLPKLPETAWFDLAPDWVCEILSPATTRIDRTDKLAIYAEFGVSHVWLIDPGLKTLEVLALTNGASLLVSTFKDNDTVATPPFAAHEFPLDGLWQDT